MAISSASHRRLLCTAATAAPSATTKISASVAKSRLRKEFDPDRALAILSSVDPSARITPASSRYALDLAVRRLFRARRLSDVETLVESRKSPGSSEPYLATLISTYATARMLDQALQTLHDVPRLTGSPPSSVSLNAFLSACVRGGDPRRALQQFSPLCDQYSIEPDAITFSVLIKCHCLVGDIDKAFECFKEMVERRHLEPTSVTYTTLLDYLYVDDKVEEADKLWNEMVEKGVNPDLSSYNVRIGYYAKKGETAKTLDLIKEIKAAGLKPDVITYNYLMTSYCIEGKFEEAKKLYKEFKGRGCAPNAATFKILMGRLSKSGDANAAFEVFEDSFKANRIPDFQSVQVLVKSLVKSGATEKAKVVIEKVKGRFPASLVSGWAKVEEKLGLSSIEQVSDQVVAA